jgi:site-specific DNA-methyltransferase (adenine-specific)
MEQLAVNKIYNADCVEGMRNLPDAVVDLVITDPPFAIEFKAKRANYNRTPSRVLEGYSEIPADKYHDFTRDWMTQVHRLLKDSGSMYVFSGWNNLKDILNALDEIGFVTINHLIWKYQFGVVTRKKFVTSHYHCLYVCKNESERRFFPFARFGKDERDEAGRSLHYRDKEDVWIINREYWNGDRKTPTKLPYELVEKCLVYSSQEGDLVLDPFLGSGQVAVVCKMLRRRYLGFEIVRDYFDFATQRLDAGTYRIKAEQACEEARKLPQ